MNKHDDIETLKSQIDAVLPQTQCGLCTFKACMPYAEALANNIADIDLCPPGGLNGLKAIASLVNVDPAPYIKEMENKAKPNMLAVIREDECIGCTKCIQACPVDAILGAAKQMHTVIASECTGCELCVAPCPVDCIDIITIADNSINKADQYRQRYNAREKRLANTTKQEYRSTQTPLPTHQNKSEKNAYIQAALLRAKEKKKNAQ